jgi:hypothetical protein
MTLFQKLFLFTLLVFLQLLAKNVLIFLKHVLQSIEECTTIKEKVKKYIAERNAHEGVAGSGSGDADAPSTLATQIPTEQDTSAPGEDATRDGVDN